MRYFEVLGISPVRLEVDLKNLESAYYAASLTVHPDRNLSQADANERAAEVNQAYQTLRDPWRRAQYFVECVGLSLSSEGPSKLALDFFDTPPDEMKSKLDQEGLQLEQSLGNCFESFDRGGDLKTTAQTLKSLIIEHKYLVSMIRNLAT